MPFSTVASAFCRALLRQLDGLARDVAFRAPAALGHMLHRVAIAIAGGKIHRAVGCRRILAQGLFDHAHRLNKRAPVHSRQKSETADAVADGDLVDGLLLILRLHGLLNRQSGFGEPLFDPGERPCQRRALALQPAGELRHKCTRHRRAGPCHVGDHQNETLRILLRDLHHLICPEVGAVAVDSMCCHPRRRAPEIFDQCQAEHDGDSP